VCNIVYFWLLEIKTNDLTFGDNLTN